MSCTPIITNSAKSLETASNQDDTLNSMSQESLTETELTEAPQERKLYSESNSEFMLDGALAKQIASSTSSTTENKEILKHWQEDEMQAQSDKSVIINPILVGSEVWRDRRELCLLESPPDPRHFPEQYIRCDTLCLPEQISLSKRRLKICFRQISEYRDCQSKRKPNSSEQGNLLEKLIDSSEREIALEQQYVDFLVSLQSSAGSAEYDVAPGGLPREERSDSEAVLDADTPRLLQTSTYLAKDSEIVHQIMVG